MKALVFGGGGFIGSHLVGQLLDEGHIVKAVDTNHGKIAEKYSSSNNFTFYNADVSKINDGLKDFMNDCDVVFNLIAYAVPSLYIEKPLDVVDLNLFENLKIVKQCIDMKKWLIQFSSCEVYGLLGGRNGIFSEEESNLILGPVNKTRWIYSCAKQMLERIIYAYGDEKLLKFTIIRPFNFIGPNMDFLVKSKADGMPRVFASFMSSLLYKEPLYIVDDGSNERTFTFIKDAVEAMGLILKNKEKFENKIVNVGNPANEISMKDLAYLMREIYSERILNEILPDIISVDGEEYYGKGYQDSEKRIPVIDKLTSVGWKPKYDLRSTFEISMDYYINKRMAGEL
jgi:UDP-apiose/xylose synthase